jgi:hypothetical protein
VVVTCRPGDADAVRAAAGPVPVTALGTVGGAEVVARTGGTTARVAVQAAREAYERTIPEALA